MQSPFEIEDRILILAPTGRDAALIAQCVARLNLRFEICGNVNSFCDCLEEGAGAGIIAEESLDDIGLARLSRAVENEPHWSDFPLIVLTLEGAEQTIAGWQSRNALGAAGNVTLLERPFQEVTLLSSVKVAIRARRKQYQVRDYLHERTVTEATLRESEHQLRVLAQELDNRVKQRTADLVRANQELQGFTYSIAHDLRSPLRRLMFNSEVIRNDYVTDLDSEGQELLKELTNEAKKLSALVEDLLSYARLGQQPVIEKRVNLSEIAHDVVKHLEDCSHIRFCIRPKMQTYGDPSLIELVLQNLIDNACKYIGPTENPAVEVGYDEDQQAFFVRDNGIGFDMRFVSKVFEPFERLHRDAEFPGTGIGLANVKRIVERHNGRVWASSKLGEGATFYFTLGEVAEDHFPTASFERPDIELA